jgi:enhancing lycopene biosynthesis protein 2
MIEAARIARGRVAPLSTLRTPDFDAAIFPGGFGVAKNLCTFAKEGANCTVIPEVERVVKEFHEAGKPIGMCCIAPVIAARVLGTKAGGPGCQVTLGEDTGAAAAIGKMGATSVPRKVTEAVTDSANRLATAPAYMDGSATPWQVYEGIGKMIEQVLAMTMKPMGTRQPARV